MQRMKPIMFNRKHTGRGKETKEMYQNLNSVSSWVQTFFVVFGVFTVSVFHKVLK